MATIRWPPERYAVITIANGADTSDVLDMRVGKRSSVNILIQGPAAALTGTITVQVCLLGIAGPWGTLQSGGADVELPTAAGGIAKVTPLDPLTVEAMRLVSSTNESGAKAFIVRGETRD